MKKTNIILAIIIAVFVLSAAIILIIAVNNNKERETIPTDIDFETLSFNIEETTDFGDSKMENIILDDLVQDYGIYAEWVEEVIGKKPYVNVASKTYIIIKATEGNIQNVISALEDYGNNYENIWKRYLPEEYELVKARKIGSKGNYVYFIVDDYAEDIINLIK